MAFHHVALFFTLIFLWHLLASAQLSLENQRSFLSSSDRSKQLFLRQPVRATRKISQRAFQDMDLFTARGYGKRADCSGRLCAKRMPQFSGARLYGKRNIEMSPFQCLFLDCMDLEPKLRNMDYPTRKLRRDEEIVLPD